MRASRVIFSLLVFAGVFLVGVGASAWADSSAEGSEQCSGIKRATGRVGSDWHSGQNGSCASESAACSVGRSSAGILYGHDHGST